MPKAALIFFDADKIKREKEARDRQVFRPGDTYPEYHISVNHPVLHKVYDYRRKTLAALNVPVWLGLWGVHRHEWDCAVYDAISKKYAAIWGGTLPPLPAFDSGVHITKILSAPEIERVNDIVWGIDPQKLIEFIYPNQN